MTFVPLCNTSNGNSHKGLRFSWWATIRAIALTGVCVFSAAAYSKNAIAAVGLQSEAQGTPLVAEAPVRFRSNGEDYSRQIVGSLGFVLLIAVAGLAAVKFTKRRNHFLSRGKVENIYSVRLLSFRRLAPRLNVLVIDVGQGKIVTLADNGNSLLKLAEFERNDASQATPAHEINHEK